MVRRRKVGARSRGLRARPRHLLLARELQIDFFPTEWVVKKGHRLGLWLSSSNYPMFSLHLNTEEPWYEARTLHLADQQVELGGSALELRLAP